MRDKKRWSTLVLAVIMVAALSLTGCRKEREKLNIPDNTENTTLVSTESESESETASEKITEPVTEKPTEPETNAPDASNTQQTEANNTPTIIPDANNGGTTGGDSNGTSNGGSNGGDASGTNNGGSNGGDSSGTNNGGSNGGDASGTNNGGDASGEGTGDGGTVTTEAPRYFFNSSGSRVDVTQMPDGSWQDANGISYTFYENGVKDSNGTQYYYDPPSNGNTSVEVGTQADFYDAQGNHIVCTMDENGNWVDSEGNTYTFGDEGVTDSNGNFHPY